MRGTYFKPLWLYRRLAGLFLLAGTIALLAADDAYVREIQKSRQEDDELMRSPKSPLLLVGRFKIEEGESTLGSSAKSNIVLPEGAPGQVGAILRRGSEISLLTATATTLAVNDKPVTGRVNLKAAAAPAPADRVSFGDFTFAIRPVGEDFYLFLIDKHSKYLKDFKGKSWFPIDLAYRVTAQLVPYDQPKTRAVADTTGSMRTYRAPGVLVFQFGGQTLRLEPLSAGDELLVMFQDKTSGKETYGGGRFLEAAMPQQGQTTLDFNKAYNPYCAANPYASCPMPPPGNRLPVPITAGETYKALH